MHNPQNSSGDDQDRVRSTMKKMEEEYIQLGKNISRIVLEANRRIDGYADEIIELEQNRKGKDK